MAEKSEGLAVRLMRFLALGVPTVSRILAVALIIAAGGIAFFDVGTYSSDNDRALVAAVLALTAIVSIVIGLLVPGVMRRILPPR